MKMLITGSDGQLGSEVVKQLEKKHDGSELIKTTINEIDITNYEMTINTIKEVNPQIIINCAAYTNVDDCESNIDHAYRVNAIGCRNIALGASVCNCSVVHMSTDYIFDGTKNDEYNEFDQANPLNIYGSSKLAGEKYLKELTHKHFIIRSSWLYGANGNNFVKTILRLAKENSLLSIVDDQIGCPTDVKSLAAQILRIIEIGKYGTYHASCKGYCSWYEFACEIIRLTGLDISVRPIKTKDYLLAAVRPKFSALDNYILRLDNEDIMPHWKESIETFLKENPWEQLL